MGFAPYSSKGRGDRSAGDRSRHRGKLDEAIKKSIKDAISEESIITGSPNKKVKVPVKGIKEYRFVYGDNSPNVGTGTGNGDLERNQRLKRGQPGKEPGEAGQDPGEDIIEVEIELSDIIDYLFEDLELPDLDRKRMKMLESERSTKHKSYRKQGIRVRMDKRRTMKERVKRKFASGWKPEIDENGDEERFPFIEHDFRYKHLVEEFKPQSNAVVIFMMDVSGSMGPTEKDLARSLFFLLYHFIKHKYEKTDVVFISHHTEAKEVDEYTFFHRGESGGTMISSVFAQCKDIIEKRYNPDAWNIYTFYCSDGDNFSSDNPKVISLIREMSTIVNRIGYAEANIYGRTTSVSEEFKKLALPNFKQYIMRDKNDIWAAFKKMLESEYEVKRK